MSGLRDEADFDFVLGLDSDFRPMCVERQVTLCQASLRRGQVDVHVERSPFPLVRQILLAHVIALCVAGGAEAFGWASFVEKSCR